MIAKVPTRMRLYFSSAVSAALLVLASSYAQATIYLNDNFNTYSDGNLVGQGGWAQQGSTTTNPIQVVGGKVVLGTTGQDANSAFTGGSAPATAGTSLYTVFDLTITSVQTAGDYFLHLSDTAGSISFYERIFAKSDGAGGFFLGLVDTSGTGSTPTYGTTSLSLNSLYNVTVAWNFVAGANNDTFAIYVGGASSPYLTHTWTSTSIAEPTSIGAANLRQGAPASAPGVTIDNLIVTDVNPIPEPSTYAMLLAGVGLVFWTLRRKRQTA